jgi:hypothetical protein
MYKMTFPCISFQVQAFWYRIDLTLGSEDIETDEPCMIYNSKFVRRFSSSLMHNTLALFSII